MTSPSTATPIQNRFREWLKNNPAWASYVESLDGQWLQLVERLHALYAAGHTVAETLSQLAHQFGIQQDTDAELDKLRAEHKRQADTITRQTATINRYEAQFKDVTKLPHDAREQLLRQLDARLSHRQRR